MKEALSQNNVEYFYVDIFSSIASLKRFLKIRDTSEQHAATREKHMVGIPCIVCENKIFLADSGEDVKKLVEQGSFN